MARRALLLTLITTVLITTGLLAVWSGPVSAHDGLVVGVPNPGELIGGDVEVLQLFLGEPIETVEVRVLDPDRNDITGEITEPYDGFVEVQVPALETEGVYVVAYNVSYADEAIFEAAYQFTFAVDGPQPELLVAGEFETSRSTTFVAAIWVLVASTLALVLLFAWRFRQSQLARLDAEESELPGG